MADSSVQEPRAYTITVQEAPSVRLAIIKGEATMETLASKITEILPEVWMFLQMCRVPNPGINVVYYPETHETSPDRPTFPIEVGAQVHKSFPSHPPIYSSSTPAGRIATTTHIGQYHLLHEAHAAIQNFCKKNNHALAGPNWEIYGHWTDDPTQLRTEVFYLLLR